MAIFSSACSLSSTPPVSDPFPNRETAFAEPKKLVDEERVEPAQQKSTPDQFLPTESDLAERKKIYHKLRHGETLSSLSRIYRVPVDRLMRANRITDPTRIPVGTLIFIPRSSATLGPEALATGALSWPLRGRITAKFGLRGKQSRHEGIDIDGQEGDEITTAADGTVIQVGTQGNYGRTVVLDHGDGLTTLYAHLGKLLVRVGDRIERGDPIAQVGRSGNARGTHLHFEVRRRERPVDPIPYLENNTVARHVQASKLKGKQETTRAPNEDIIQLRKKLEESSRQIIELEAELDWTRKALQAAERELKSRTDTRWGEASVSPREKPVSEPGTIKPVIYQTIRTTSVFTEPSAFSLKVASIPKGTTLSVVGSAGEWLEIRSRQGRPPGFVHREDAMVAKSSD